MGMYKISAQNIKKTKRKYLFSVTVLSVIGVMLGFCIAAVKIDDANTVKKIVTPFVLLTGVVLYFSIRFIGVEPLTKSILSLTYILENNRFIIKYNDHERLNISKDDIKQIIRYKNNAVTLVLKNAKKINLNRKMENYELLISELNEFCEITRIDKNQNQAVNIISGIVSACFICIFLFTSNLFAAIILGGIIIVFFLAVLIYVLLNKSIDKKTKRNLLFVSAAILYIVVDKILKLM
jgi:hypothetical protein